MNHNFTTITLTGTNSMIQKKLSWLAMIVMAHSFSVQAVEKNTVASNDYW